MQFSLQQQHKTSGFYSTLFCFTCVAEMSPLKSKVSGNVFTAIQPFAPLDCCNSMRACVLSPRVYDNEACDAVVCLTLRGSIIQFIHLMRPTYLASLICFQGDRSKISETTV